MGDCAKNFYTWSCMHDREPHCITQINPDEIVAAYDTMADFIRTSKKIKCPPTLQSVSQDIPFCTRNIFGG